MTSLCLLNYSERTFSFLALSQILSSVLVCLHVLNHTRKKARDILPAQRTKAYLLSKVVCPLRLYVRPSICNNPILYQNGLTYRRKKNSKFTHHLMAPNIPTGSPPNRGLKLRDGHGSKCLNPTKPNQLLSQPNPTQPTCWQLQSNPTQPIRHNQYTHNSVMKVRHKST